MRNLLMPAIFKFFSLSKCIAEPFELKASIHIDIGKRVAAFLPFYASFVQIVLFKDASWLM